MIRTATEADLGVLVEMARSFHKESPRYRGIEFIEEDCLTFLTGALEKVDTQRIFLSENNGVIDGMLGGILSVYASFNHSVLCSCDTGFYVSPEKRASSVAYKLVKAYEEWSSDKGVLPENMSIAVSAGVKSAKVYRFLEKMGYTEQGRSFRKVIQKES